MSIDIDQFYKSVLCKTLQFMDTELKKGMDSLHARKLLLATFCHESLAGTYLEQINGPAKGVYMIEPPTHMHLTSYIMRKKLSSGTPWIDIIKNKYGSAPCVVSNLGYATLMARLKYWTIPDPIPTSGNIEELANYWGKYYQTDSQTDELNSKEKLFIQHAKKYATKHFE